MKNVSEIVKNELKKNNIKYVELAKYLNVSSQNLYSLLNSTDNWTFKNVVLVCEFLKLDFKIFLDDDSILRNIVSETPVDVFELLKKRFESIENRLDKLEGKT